jgi:hypothetical protein
MRFTVILFFSALASYVAAAPYFPFPLRDGFPTPNPKQLQEIELAAGGTLPNGGLPTALKSAAVPVLQLLALTELFEVAFFNELIHNITNNVHGYECQNERAYVLNTLTAILKVDSPLCDLSLLNFRWLSFHSARRTPCTWRQRHPRQRETHNSYPMPIYLPRLRL